MKVEPRLNGIIDWIRRTTDVASGRGVLVPVSGGTDSALSFWLCSQALPPGAAVAAFVGERLRCRDWFERLGPVRCLPAPPATDQIETRRWAMLLSEARSVRGWLVGSRNRTEEVLGTYSLASRLATCLPLARLWKSEVMELAKAVGLPDEVLESSRRADPECGRPRELAEIPFGDVDLFLKVRVGEHPESTLLALDPCVVEYLNSVYRRNRFKHEIPLRPPAETGVNGEA